MQYKVSINLDRILAKNGYSQRQLIKDSGLSHNFITKLTQHKEIANLDKLVKIINTLNQRGLDITPSDLITFEPIGKTKVTALANQHEENVYTFFFQLAYEGKSYKDLVQLTIKQNNTDIKIHAQTSETTTFTKDMQDQLFAQSFYLGRGVDTMVAMVEHDKRVAAQALSKLVIEQAVNDNVITANKHVNKVIFDYFDTFELTFNNVQFRNNIAIFTKDRQDSIKPLIENAHDATYPWHGPHSTGYVEKRNHI